MWSLRRASFRLRNQGLSLRTAQIVCGKSEIEKCCLENCNAGYIEPQGRIFDRLLTSARSYSSFSGFSLPHFEARTFSSDASSKSCGEEDGDSEDGFSELEVTNDGSISEADLSEEEDVPEADADEKKPSKTKGISALSKAVLVTSSVGKVLDKWVEDGNELTDSEILSTMLCLRKKRLYVKALQMSEWLESTKHYDYGEKDYASRVDLVAKIRGVYDAEAYIKKVPESFRSQRVYRSLLANYVAIANVKKSEEVFNKIRSSFFPLSSFACNQMLLLYKRTDKKKVADILLLMEKENLKPTLFTYQVLIDIKGQVNDINGMEQIVETMKAEGVPPNAPFKVSLAQYYANSGLEDKAEAILKDLEGDNLSRNRQVSAALMRIYASIRKEDEVERIWKACESDPWLKECMAAIEAWGKLNRIENAESAFEKMLTKTNRPSANNFTSLLKVYTDHKMLEKGKELVKRMEESGCAMGPVTWDALVKLYIEDGELEKADGLIEKASKQKKGKPMFTSYMSLLHNYSKRGDVHNAEKIFMRMKKAGYASRIQQFRILLQAYLNSKTPVYGFIDRMKADNMFPNREMADLLSQADAFKKTALSELLD